MSLRLPARKRDSGLAVAISDRPRVSLVFFEMDGPGARASPGPRRLRVVARPAGDPAVAEPKDAHSEIDVAPWFPIALTADTSPLPLIRPDPERWRAIGR